MFSRLLFSRLQCFARHIHSSLDKRGQTRLCNLALKHSYSTERFFVSFYCRGLSFIVPGAIIVGLGVVMILFLVTRKSSHTSRNSLFVLIISTFHC